MTEMSTVERPATNRLPRASRKPRSASRSIGSPLRGLLPIVVLLSAWQLFGSSTSLSFPTPGTWIDALRDMNDEGILMPAVRTTLITFVLSFVLALVVGMGVGLVVGSSPRVRRATGPLLDFMRSLPPPVIIPVGVLLLGFTTTMAVVTVAFSVVWPVLLGTLSARRSIPPARLEMGQVLGLGWFERFWKINVPSVMPGAFAGIKLCISYSLVTSLLVDILASTSGIGRIIYEKQQFYEASAVWGLLAIVGIFGYLVNVVLVFIEGRMLRNYGVLV